MDVFYKREMNRQLSNTPSRQSSQQSSQYTSQYSSRASTPLNIRTPPKGPPLYMRALQYGIKYGLPAGVLSLATVYRKPIYNTVKDIANYGKRMTINALAAIRNTPYKVEPYSPDSSDNEDYTQQITPTPRPRPTPLPNPTVDVQHPKTSI